MSDQFDRLKEALADRYAVEREIGSGGMATVYLARDLRHHRNVAIKVLRPDLAATLGPERFDREIRIAAQLQHPHILPLLDSGSVNAPAAGDDDGPTVTTFLFFVMPYIEGQSLRDKLAREGALPIGDAVRILRDVVDALTEAHAHGVVHRDIKPENILLRGRHALVTDFGVAKAVSEATGREQLTTAGVALGTPAYMAPEQAAADPNIDHRVDIYAIGAVAYELLTNRPVFMGTTPQMVLSAHVTEAPEPVTKHRETVPAALEAIVMRCLEKKPGDRWQSVEELLPQLEALATPSGGMTPAQTQPVAAPRRQRKWLWRAGIPSVAAVLAAVGLWIGLGSRDAASDTAAGDRVAVLAFEHLGESEEDEIFADGIARDVSTQLAKIAALEVIAFGTTRQFSVQEHPYARIATELAARYLVDGSVRRSGDRVRISVSLVDPSDGTQLWAEDYDRALTSDAYFDIQRDVARQIASALRATLSPIEEEKLAARPTEDLEALRSYHLGRFYFSRFSGVQDNFTAVQYLEDAIRRDSSFAAAYAALADVYVARAPGVSMEEAVRRARDLAERAIALDSTLGAPHTTLGAVAMWRDWDWEASRRAFERALQLEPTYAQGHQWYAELLAALGEGDRAVAEVRRAAELDPLSPVIQWNVGRILVFARRFAEAEAQYTQMLESEATRNLGAGELLQLYWVQGRDDRIGELIESGLVFAVDPDMLDTARARFAEGGMRAVYEPWIPTEADDSVEVWAGVGAASTYAMLGYRDLALTALERAWERRTFGKTISDLVMTPELDPIRSDERYQAIMRAMRLPVVIPE